VQPDGVTPQGRGAAPGHPITISSTIVDDPPPASDLVADDCGWTKVHNKIKLKNVSVSHFDSWSATRGLKRLAGHTSGVRNAQNKPAPQALPPADVANYVAQHDQQSYSFVAERQTFLITRDSVMDFKPVSSTRCLPKLGFHYDRNET